MGIIEGGDPWDWGRDVLFPHLLSLFANIFGGLPMVQVTCILKHYLHTPNNYSNYLLKICSVPGTVVSALQA